MRSPGSRRALEWALRGAAITLLAWALVAALRPPAARATDAVATWRATTDTAARRAVLSRWSRDGALARVHVTLDAATTPRDRDWLRALGEAGTRVTWSGDVAPMAVAIEPLVGPRGGARVLIAAPVGGVHVSDAVGLLDSVIAGGGGATVRAASIVGVATVRAGLHLARAATVADTGAPRAVVVLGSAGWEPKFVTAALEEAGWRVALRLPVAPGIAVTQGLGSVGGVVSVGGIQLDTARVAAVIALDSTAAPFAGAIAAFVRQGGGLLLGPDATRAAALATLAPARPGALVRGTNTFAAATAPVRRATLDYRPLLAPRVDAVLLEARGATPVIAARRVEAGRVVQIGQVDTWRWRMAGDASGPASHRAFWSGLVESVAYAGAASPAVAGSPDVDPAPLAGLVHALGPASTAPPAPARRRPFDPTRDPRLFLAVAALLLLEWASRRLRGER